VQLISFRPSPLTLLLATESIVVERSGTYSIHKFHNLIPKYLDVVRRRSMSRHGTGALDGSVGLHNFCIVVWIKRAMLASSHQPHSFHKSHHVHYNSFHPSLNSCRERIAIAYLNTLPSAHGYSLPSTTTGFSQVHCSLTNSLSSAFVGSNLVNS
jgi:hypothetical protein